VALREGEDGVEVGAQAEQVDGDDADGALRDELVQQARVEVECGEIDVAEDRLRAEVLDHVRRRHPSEAGDDDVVARLHPERGECDVERGRPGRGCYTVTRAGVGADLLLERLHLGALDDPARLERALHRPQLRLADERLGDGDPRHRPHTTSALAGRSGRTSVVTVAYDSGPALTRLLESLAGEEEAEVVVVNTGPRGPEIEQAASLPFVRVVEPGTNIGYAGGGNLGAREAGGDVLVFLNPDTVVRPGALARLAETLEDRSIGIAMARLLLLDRPDTLNSGGNVLHISGIAWAGGYGEPAASVSEVREVAYPSGAAMAIRRELFLELDGFAEELFMYQEDLELAWRTRLRGLRIVVDPGADVLHEYEFGRNPRKLYYLERNRLVFVLTAYSGRLLAVVAPVVLAAEAATLALAVREGWGRQKVAGWSWLARNAGWLRGRRRETQALRRVSDRDLAPLLTARLDPAHVPVPRPIRAVNGLLERYWAWARRAL
jgi:GT2 family glycosyltransferase